MLKKVLKTAVPLILFLFIITNTLLANQPDNKPKNIFRSKCENSTKEISLLDGFEDKSFIIEILDFGGGYISFKMTLYNNSDCKSSWLNKLEYFEIKNYILLTENLESLKSGKKINMSNSTLWTPSGKIMELRTTSEKVAKELMIPKKCSLLQNSGEPVIIDKNCMGDNEFFQFKKKKDFFPGAFLALKYDNELNRLLLFENDEGDSYNNVNRYISLFPTYTD